MRCAAHTLNLVATTDADNALKDPRFNNSYVTIFNKCRTLWNKQNQSIIAAETIKAEFGKKFVTPNQTRWNSIYDSIVCLLEIIDNCKDLKSFNQVITDPHKNIKVGKFLTSDVAFLRQYQAVMFSVANGLDTLQSEKKAYMGIFCPVICLIRDELQDCADNENLDLVKPLIRALIKGMEKRLKEALDKEEYLLAAAFHPEFRLEWMERMLPRKVELTLTRMKELVLSELKAMNVSTQGQDEGQEQVGHEEDTAQKPKSPAKKSWLSKLKNKGTQGSGDDAVLMRKATSIIDTWRGGATEEGAKFTDSVFLGEKALVNLFIRFNTGIPSSAGVERLFSIGKLILRDNRSRLSDENFERLMLMQGNSNLK